MSYYCDIILILTTMLYTRPLRTNKLSTERFTIYVTYGSNIILCVTLKKCWSMYTESSLHHVYKKWLVFLVLMYM